MPSPLCPFQIQSGDIRAAAQRAIRERKLKPASPTGGNALPHPAFMPWLPGVRSACLNSKNPRRVSDCIKRHSCPHHMLLSISKSYASEPAPSRRQEGQSRLRQVLSNGRVGLSLVFFLSDGWFPKGDWNTCCWGLSSSPSAARAWCPGAQHHLKCHVEDFLGLNSLS